MRVGRRSRWREGRSRRRESTRSRRREKRGGEMILTSVFTSGMNFYTTILGSYVRAVRTREWLLSCMDSQVSEHSVSDCISVAADPTL